MAKQPVYLNMQFLRKSRPNLRPGDVFTFLMPDGLYRFGRVIRTDATIGRFPNCILLYIYSATSKSKDTIPPLFRDKLLIPPKGTNRQGWLRGYFEDVSHRPLEHEDVLPVHCFWDPTYGCYRDADDRKLPSKVEPCGFYALSSYRTIDDDISRALGIPLAPD